MVSFQWDSWEAFTKKGPRRRPEEVSGEACCSGGGGEPSSPDTGPILVWSGPSPRRASVVGVGRVGLGEEDGEVVGPCWLL